MSKLLPTCYRRGASLPPAPPATPVGRVFEQSVLKPYGYLSTGTSCDTGGEGIKIEEV